MNVGGTPWEVVGAGTGKVRFWSIRKNLKIGLILVFKFS